MLPGAGAVVTQYAVIFVLVAGHAVFLLIHFFAPGKLLIFVIVYKSSSHRNILFGVSTYHTL